MWALILVPNYIRERIRAILRDVNRIHVTPEIRTRMVRSAEMMRFFSWFGVIVTAIAISWYAREMVRESFALRAPGKIIMFTYERSKNPIPVFRYKLPDGRVFTSNPGFSSRFFNYDIGDDITVYYWPSSPEAGTIAGVYFTLARILGFFGAFFAIACRLGAAWRGSELAARIGVYIWIKLP